jgi:coenzyme F420 hydrogenase subunit beta
VGSFQRRPSLATSSEEIKEAAGFFFDTSHGMKSFGDQYLLYSSIEEFDPMIKKGLRRVALVGTPCQIKSVRRMQTLGLVPSDAIQLCLGLFCSGNFTFGEEQRRQLAAAGGFRWEDVSKVNIKDDFMVHLKSDETKTIALDEMAFMRRYACRYCPDYAAEFADIAFGGIGAGQGWTTVVIRSPLGRAAFADAKGSAVLEEYSVKDNPKFATQALAKVRSWSAKKRKTAQQNRRQLGPKAVQVKG